ncbi:MAG: Holliday junction resolvase RuvX [Patescibacteria group bacterium]|jgi:putative Holliday junction resolvase
MRYLGIDWGKKRIGLAMADSETKMAIPFRVVKNADEVIETVKEEQIEKIIIGLPLTLSGQNGETAKEAVKFADELKKKTAVTIEVIDERLSSREADALMKKNIGQERDAVSAMLILQNYLDQNQNE